MEPIMTFISQKILPNLAVIGIVGFTALTSTAAAYKISQDLPPVQQLKNSTLVEQTTTTGTPTATPEITSTPSATPQVTSTVVDTVANNANGLPGMTLADLATHNKSGDCYIAYNKIVYNVSNHPSWGGCYHHGIRGGQDISSRFPHPTSYLNGLPKVANLIGGQVVTNNGNAQSNHETENETEFEKSENHKDNNFDD